MQKRIHVIDNYGINCGTVRRSVRKGPRGTLRATISKLDRELVPVVGLGLAAWLGAKAKLPRDLKRARS